MVVHTEQWFNTDHASSVVLLLRQKQLFHAGMLLGSAHCTVHGNLGQYLQKASICGPVMVWKRQNT